ncbi:MAG: hypothetical protein AAAFM81_00830 [Pseudomonadota bacterium]
MQTQNTNEANVANENLMQQVLAAVQQNPQLATLVGNFAAQYLEPGVTRNLADIFGAADQSDRTTVDAEFYDDFDSREPIEEELDSHGVPSTETEALDIFMEAFGLCPTCLTEAHCRNCENGELPPEPNEPLLLELLLPVLPKLTLPSRRRIFSALKGRPQI